MKANRALGLQSPSPIKRAKNKPAVCGPAFLSELLAWSLGMLRELRVQAGVCQLAGLASGMAKVACAGRHRLEGERRKRLGGPSGSQGLLVRPDLAL